MRPPPKHQLSRSGIQWSPPTSWRRGKPRPIEAEESLDALLARRAEVRPKTTTADPMPELFRPANAPKLEEGAAAPGTLPPAVAKEGKKSDKPEATQTTSRLLEAKRPAQKRS